ncbi:MAG: hypothetical protein II399_09585, partial [Lachnospiraceae bacterium]|nr:hypothetical protein [Lachnospiraceae bacterium]
NLSSAKKTEIIVFANNKICEVLMKKIGLVGGTGPESTVMYYKKLNSEIDLLTNEGSGLTSLLRALISEGLGIML